MRWISLKSIRPIFFVLLLAIALRCYQLSSVPPALYWEEVALGYDAYSIAKTGKDHHGNSYPIIAFPSFGDYKPSAYFYAIVPFIKLFGLNEWSVRLPAAVAGIIAIFFVYQIGKELFDEKKALLASVLFAIQPWHLQFSRGGWEVNLALTFMLVATYAMLRAKRLPWFLLVSVLFFGLSLYTYHAARVFAPLIGCLGGLSLLGYWIKTKQFKHVLLPLGLSIILAITLIAPFILNLGDIAVSSRFSQTSIFTDIDPILKSNAAIKDAKNSFISKIVHHRFRYFGEIIASQYSSHFSVPFLFFRGDGNYRHGIDRGGLLYPVEAVGICLSLLFLLQTIFKRIASIVRTKSPALSRIPVPNIGIFKKKEFLSVAFILIWIGISAIAPSIVKPAPHALRFLFASPGFAFLSSIGFVTLFQLLQKRYRIVFFGLMSVAYLFFVTAYLSWYYLAYPVISSNDWQFGYKELYAALGKHRIEDEFVFVSRDQGRPSMYYLFYSQFDPALLQQMEPMLPKDQLELLQVGNYHFIDRLEDKPGLYATNAEAMPMGSQVVDTIRRPDDSIVWVVWRKQ